MSLLRFAAVGLLLTGCATSGAVQRPPPADEAKLGALLKRVEAAAEAHFESHPYSQVWMAVDRSALAYNAERVKARIGDRRLCAVVKGDAYGHGIEIAAPAFAPHADAFCISENRDALRLRKLGLEHPIVRIRLASLREVREARKAKLGLQEFVGSLATATAMSAMATESEPIEVHVVLDSTKMGRNGFPLGKERAATLSDLAELARLPGLSVVAITSHLPGADAEDFGPSVEKARRFLADAAAVHAVLAEGGHDPAWHLSNSAASARLPESIHAKLAMDRVGGSLYGMQNYEGEDLSPWREAVTVVSHVAAVHRRSAGDTFGYGSAEASPEDDFLVANIGVGWLNLPRQLSGRGFVFDEGGQPHRILGKLSMNTTVVPAVSAGGSELAPGDRIVLLSPIGPRIEDAAKIVAQPASYVVLSIARNNVARFAISEAAP